MTQDIINLLVVLIFVFLIVHAGILAYKFAFNKGSKFGSDNTGSAIIQQAMSGQPFILSDGKQKIVLKIQQPPQPPKEEPKKEIKKDKKK